MHTKSLSIIRNRLFNYYEHITNIKLELDIEDLDKEIVIKEMLLKKLDEQEEKVKVELETEQQLNNSYMESVEEDLDKIKEKSAILKKYLSVMASDEFELIKLKSENEVYIKDFWNRLRELSEKSKRFPEELENLKKVKESRDELKEKAEKLMAPSH